MANIMAEEVRLEKMIHENLKTELEANKDGGQSQPRDEEVILSTTFTNLSKDPIIMVDRFFWAGAPDNDIPALRSGCYTVLKQKGTLPQGVRWGQVWANGDDSTARKWVVAFDTAAGKAYVEAGPIGPVDWNVVAVKLSISESKTEYEDPILGGKVVAEIKGFKAYATFR